MSYIITVASLKGGTGKSTISTNLAAALASRGKSVLLVDLDEQGSTASWISQVGDRSGLDAATVAQPGRLGVYLERISHDVVLIDCPPELRERTVEAVKVADLVLSPVKPSGYDILAAMEMVRLVRATRIGTRPRLAFVVSMAGHHRSRLAGSLRDALEGVGEDLLETTIRNRSSWAESSLGQVIIDMGDHRAEEELDQLTTEVLRYVEEAS